MIGTYRSMDKDMGRDECNVDENFDELLVITVPKKIIYEEIASKT